MCHRCLLARAARTPARVATASPRPTSCPPRRDQLFTRLPSNATGVRFENRLEQPKTFNVFTYRNFYNGGGVAIGDLTGDGLPEIVLTANETGPRLYLNRGQFAFRDVTDAVGRSRARRARGRPASRSPTSTATAGSTSTSARRGRASPATRANELWINQGLGRDGVPTFKEMARQYGIADEGYTTQAAFLDYDGDGDLDLFVVNNSPKPANSFSLRNSRDEREPVRRRAALSQRWRRNSPTCHAARGDPRPRDGLRARRRRRRLERRRAARHLRRERLLRARLPLHQHGQRHVHRRDREGRCR